MKSDFCVIGPWQAEIAVATEVRLGSSLTIQQARLVLPDRVVLGDLVIEDGLIAEVAPRAQRPIGPIISGVGLTVLPGLIDPAVAAFENPGPGQDDFGSLSRAALAGGYTSLLVLPESSTNSAENLQKRLELAGKTCHTHFSCWAAPPDDPASSNAMTRACGMALRAERQNFGDVDELTTLFSSWNGIFGVLPLDQARLHQRLTLYEGADIRHFSKVVDIEGSLAFLRSLHGLAHKMGADLHLLALSAAEEMDAWQQIQGERNSCQINLPHLILEAETAYSDIGTRAITLPPVRGRRHGHALLASLDGPDQMIGSGHVARPLADDSTSVRQAAFGLPGIQFCLPLLLGLVAQGRLTLPSLAALTSDRVATRMGIPRKGRLETGFDGDIVVVDTAASMPPTDDKVLDASGWTPYIGQTTGGSVVAVALRGQIVWQEGTLLKLEPRGRELPTFLTHRRSDVGDWS